MFIIMNINTNFVHNNEHFKDEQKKTNHFP